MMQVKGPVGMTRYAPSSFRGMFTPHEESLSIIWWFIATYVVMSSWSPR